MACNLHYYSLLFVTAFFLSVYIPSFYRSFVSFIKFKQFGDIGAGFARPYGVNKADAHISYCFAHQMFILLLPCFYQSRRASDLSIPQGFDLSFLIYHQQLTPGYVFWLSYISMRHFFTSPLFLATLCVLFHCFTSSSLAVVCCLLWVTLGGEKWRLLFCEYFACLYHFSSLLISSPPPPPLPTGEWTLTK